MTLTELLPALHGLPRDERLRAIQLLAAGEDYLYPADDFLPVALPTAVAEQLAVPA